MTGDAGDHGGLRDVNAGRGSRFANATVASGQRWQACARDLRYPGSQRARPPASCPVVGVGCGPRAFAWSRTFLDWRISLCILTFRFGKNTRRLPQYPKREFAATWMSLGQQLQLFPAADRRDRIRRAMVQSDLPGAQSVGGDAVPVCRPRRTVSMRSHFLSSRWRRISAAPSR